MATNGRCVLLFCLNYIRVWHRCSLSLLNVQYGQKKGVVPMKIVLKVLALPLLFIVTIACILGNLITNISSYVIALLLLVIAGCSIYCIVKALWTSLAILAGMGLTAILIIFLLVWAVVKLETLGNHIKEFICY